MAYDAAAERRRFEECISFYLNQTLGAEDRTFVEQYLRDHPEAHAELACWRELRPSLAQEAMAAAPDVGLAKLQARMQAVSAPPRLGLADRLAALVRSIVAPSKFARGAFAALGILVLLQAGAILALLMRQPGGAQLEVAATRSLGKPVQAGDTVSAKFRPGISVDVVSQVLRNLDASIVDGPGEGGRYIIKLPRQNAAEALQKLTTGGILVEAKAATAVERPAK